jgi:signal transduction histidine kinase
MKNNIAFSLSKRVTLGYVIIIGVALVSSTYSIYMLQLNKSIDKKIQDAYWPMYLKLKDLQALNKEAAKLTNHWVYQPNINEKQLLKQLIQHDYASLKVSTLSLIDHQNEGHARSIADLFESFDEIIRIQRLLMLTLSSDNAYSDDLSVDNAIAIWSESVEPGTRQLDKDLATLIAAYGRYLGDLQQTKEQADTFLSIILIVVVFIFIAAFIGSYAFAQRHIVQPIMHTKNLLVTLSEGKPIESLSVRRNDEIGAMMRAMNSLSKGMNAKSIFADHIGKGMYHEQFELLSPDDRMGKSLLNMRDQLRKRNAELDRLVYSASHDLRAPITSVKGLITIIRMDPSEINLERCLVLVGKSMDRLDKVIHEIVDFFRNARSELNDTSFNIARLIHRVLEGLSAEPGFDEVNFVVKSQEVVILSDPARLELILKNLLGNAIQFRRRDIVPTVKIDVHVNSDLTLVVTDNGVGIAPALHYRVFDMFFRGNEMSSGSGMGLYIVKEVVAALGGTISLASSVGSGSEFTVRVPLKVQTNARIVRDEELIHHPELQLS